jgi:hypothetical protein
LGKKNEQSSTNLIRTKGIDRCGQFSVLNDFSWKNLSCRGAGRHPSEAHRIVLFDMDTDLRRSDVLPANWMYFPTEII